MAYAPSAQLALPFTRACSRCRGPRDRASQRYCRDCHAAYQRQNRPKHSELSPEARRKAVCRSKTHYLKRKGRLEQTPCGSCGARESEVHHLDYSDPRLVEWLCRGCHLARHASLKNGSRG